MAPKEIFVSENLDNAELLEDALGVKIRTFSKGDKYKLVENAKKNALAAIERKLAEKDVYKRQILSFPAESLLIRIFGQNYRNWLMTMG